MTVKVQMNESISGPPLGDLEEKNHPSNCKHCELYCYRNVEHIDLLLVCELHKVYDDSRQYEQKSPNKHERQCWIPLDQYQTSNE